MNKLYRLFLVITLAVSLGGGINLALGQGRGFDGVELTIVPVASNVYMVQRPGGGGNIGASRYEEQKCMKLRARD